MPNYDYCCTSCGHREEILQKMTEAPLVKCPQCHKETFKRQFGTGIGLQFQGSGFYATDYCGNASSPQSGDTKPTGDSPSKGCGCGKSSCNL